MVDTSVHAKSKVILEPLQWIKVEHQKNDIWVNPWIGMMHKTMLINNYIESFFNSDRDFVSNFIEAEYGQMLQILDLMTTVEVIDESGEATDIDGIVNSNLWLKIRNSILNYDEFRDELSFIVENIQNEKDMQKSVGYTFDRLANKLFELLDKVSQIDFTQEGIQQLVSELRKETDGFNQKFLQQPSDTEAVVAEKKPKGRRPKTTA